MISQKYFQASVSHPHSNDHESRVEFLETIAGLIDCNSMVCTQLPFRLFPDVLRINRDTNLLFIGEAKNTETPGNSQTIYRISKYFYWLAYHIHERNGKGIFAICFGRDSDWEKWLHSIENVATNFDLVPKEKGYEKFEDDLWLVWFLF